MKITKAQLRNIIKEELGMMSEQEMDLEGRKFNFAIYHTESDIGLRAYLINVPSSMLDASSVKRMRDHERLRGPGKGSERFLKPSAEALGMWPEYDARVHRAHHMEGDPPTPKPPPIIDVGPEPQG